MKQDDRQIERDALMWAEHDRDKAQERVAELEAMLRRVLESAPLCFKRGCDKPATRLMPTAVLDDWIRVCDEHCTCTENEFGQRAVEVRHAALHREIRQALDGK